MGRIEDRTFECGIGLGLFKVLIRSGDMNASFGRRPPDFWPGNIFIFAGREKKILLYTWEGSSFKLTTDCFLKTQIYFEIERASGAFG